MLPNSLPNITSSGKFKKETSCLCRYTGEGGKRNYERTTYK
jgi:hypothetical protein